METLEGTSEPTAVLIVGEDAATADLTLTVLSVLGPRGFPVPDIASATAHLNEFAEDTAAVLIDGDMDGDLTGEEFARFVALAWPHIRVGLICNGPRDGRARGGHPVARLTSPILPLELITFLQNSAREADPGA
jgi:hypothetical protein